MKSVAKRWWFWLLIVIAVAFVIVHAYLALWVRDYVNRKLSEIPGYRAHVAAVTLHLWRGAYQIHNIDIKKTSGKVPVPFFSAPLVDFSVQWHALIFEHVAVGNMEIHRAQMNLPPEPLHRSASATCGMQSPNCARKSRRSRNSVSSSARPIPTLSFQVRSRMDTTPLRRAITRS